MQPAETLLSQAMDLHRAGQLADAEALYRRILQHDPGQADALHLLGVLSHQAGDSSTAVRLIGDALRVRRDPMFLVNLSTVLADLQRWPEAETIAREAVLSDPSIVEAHNTLGTAIHRQGRLKEAIATFQSALAGHAGHPAVLTNLANALRDDGRTIEAVDCYRQALAGDPSFASAHNNLAAALEALGEVDEAIRHYHLALQVQPDFIAAGNNLAASLLRQGRVGESIEQARRILYRSPRSVDGWINLGNALARADQYDEAIDALRRALEIQPDHIFARSSLAYALHNVGDIAGAIDIYRSLVIDGTGPLQAHSSLIFAMHLMPGTTAEQIVGECRRYERRLLAAYPQAPARPPKADRSRQRLRLGYVSADFREHVVARNILPLLREHDRTKFEVTCYASVRQEDAYSSRLRGVADRWRDISRLNDLAAAELIREDGIDILVDLGLHSGETRLPIFARRPAPVQVSFAGYPGGTGLAAIDWRLSDPYLDPPGQHDGHYVERTWRLPHSFWCYDPAAMDVDPTAPISALPALANGYVTFGCLNKFSKVSEPALRLWARVLKAVPRSGLVLLGGEGRHTARASAVLADAGVAADRVSFLPRADRDRYLRWFNDIDIGLDTFPYNGHTSSLDAMWMGVPVVTRLGETAVGRGGWSQLSNLDLTHLAARDDQQYVDIAVSLARDLGGLASLRASLRGRLLASAITDAVNFTRAVEAAYLGAWSEPTT